MAINNVTLNRATPNIAPAAISATDTESKNIQNQIANKQQSLNRLSSDSELSAEEKAKERQEIQKQIAELNRKLRLLRMEQKEEAAEALKEQEKKNVLKEEMLEDEDTVQKEENTVNSPDKQDVKIEDKSLSLENIHEMLSADSQLHIERVQENMMKQKEGRENILESEIKMDELYGTDTAAKKEELSTLRKKGTIKIEVIEQPKDLIPMGVNSGAKIIITE